MMPTSAPARVVIVGSLNADLVVGVESMPLLGQTVHGSELRVLPGGKGANQAAAVGRIGGDVAILGAVGDDSHGRLLLEAARDAGADADAVVVLPGIATGTAVILVDADGQNSIVVSPGANARLGPAHLSAEFFAGAKVLCLCFEIDDETVLAAARLGRAAGATILLNPSPFRSIGDDLLSLVDIVIVNDHEIVDLLGPDVVDAGWTAVLEALSRIGVERAVVTLGARGSVVLDAGTAGERVVEVPAVQVNAVDTTGCGDAFTGAFAERVAAGVAAPEAARFASRVSAVAATRHGAQTSYPTRQELDAL